MAGAIPAAIVAWLNLAATTEALAQAGGSASVALYALLPLALIGYPLVRGGLGARSIADEIVQSVLGALAGYGAYLITLVYIPVIFGGHEPGTLLAALWSQTGLLPLLVLLVINVVTSLLIMAATRRQARR